MSDELAERVERGAALLDERRPGWWDEIDLETFEMANVCRCSLGQLWGSYAKGKEALGIDLIPGCALGFISHIADGYPVLTVLWRAAIERRRVPA
jgi:hypothetical protein